MAIFATGIKLGLIDKSGKVIIEPEFYRLERLNDELFYAMDGEHFYYIDKTGKIIWKGEKR